MDLTGIDPRAIGTEVRLASVGRENAETRGRRYLVEGRLQVLHVSTARVIARCRGTGVTHDVGFLNDRWFCSCPARSRCSHLVALQHVVNLTTMGGGSNAG